MNVTINEFEPVASTNTAAAEKREGDTPAGHKTDLKKVEHTLRLLENRRRRVRVY